MTTLHGTLSGSSRIRKDVSFSCYYEQLDDKLVAHCNFNNKRPVKNPQIHKRIEKNPRVYVKIDVTSIFDTLVIDESSGSKTKVDLIYSFDLVSDLKPLENIYSEELTMKFERKLLEEIKDAVDFLIKDNVVI